MFAGVLQHCLWTANSPYNPMRPWYGVARNMALAFVAPFRQQSTAPLLQVHKEENLKLLERGKQDLADPRMDFVMVHLGTPHYPYVFNRHTGQFTTEEGHSYQDGLAMADWALGQLLQQIESDPRWANTTLVVNGDHSWRPVIWTAEPGWTEEDQRTSDNASFDDRPAVLIHRPGQTGPTTVADAFSLLEIHAVLESAIQQPAGR
jgi:membrane-anchored protein YejM (alkaline phosphatase superfamily)